MRRVSIRNQLKQTKNTDLTNKLKREQQNLFPPALFKKLGRDVDNRAFNNVLSSLLTLSTSFIDIDDLSASFNFICKSFC